MLLCVNQGKACVLHWLADGSWRKRQHSLLSEETVGIFAHWCWLNDALAFCLQCVGTGSHCRQWWLRHWAQLHSCTVPGLSGSHWIRNGQCGRGQLKLPWSPSELMKLFSMQVMEAIFQYLAMLKKIGPQERIFNEIKTIEDNNFAWKEQVCLIWWFVRENCSLLVVFLFLEWTCRLCGPDVCEYAALCSRGVHYWWFAPDRVQSRGTSIHISIVET